MPFFLKKNALRGFLYNIRFMNGVDYFLGHFFDDDAGRRAASGEAV